MRELPTPNLLSCDLEDWFQVENLRSVFPHSVWERQPLRLEGSAHRLLDLFDRHDTKATFFALGWIAERRPGLIKEIQARGHEIASHGYDHELIPFVGPAKFTADIRRAKDLLEDITGQAVLGYRAPSFSITEWALDALAETGFRYDSSLMRTVAHDRYGRIALPPSQSPYGDAIVRPGLTEVPLSSLRLGTANIPWGGGGYFRLLPYRVYRRGVNTLARRHEALRFYFHPWEIDAGQPRVAGVGRVARYRHYQGIGNMESKLERLLSDFRFTPFNHALRADNSG